jgi:sporulation protein YlmC with PRC-barrel domain
MSPLRLSPASLTAIAVAAAFIAAPALAQTDQSVPGGSSPGGTAGPPDTARPAIGTATPANPPAANQASVASPAGTLAVAVVKMDSGWRASKLIGASVYNEHNEKIGSVDDLILTQDDKVVVAVISVGGFLGIGSKLVAVPYEQVHTANGHVNIIGATKDALNALPAFTYGNT